MADLVTFGEALLRYSPPTGVRLETAETLNVWVAGAECNVAVAATRAGADTCWISKLPASPLGRRVTNSLHEVGVDTDVVWSDDGRQGIYYVEAGGPPRGTNVHYDRTSAAIRTATSAELPTQRIEGARMFATSGITPSLSSQLAETTADLLTRASGSGTRTVLDLNYRAKLSSPTQARETVAALLPEVDIFVLGEESAERVFGCTGSPEEIARDLVDAWGFETLVLTRGSWGAVAVSKGQYVEQRAVETETVDPIGTGDAFVGGFIAALLEDDHVQRSLASGAATAALKRTIRGDQAIVTREEIDRVLAADVHEIDR